MTASLPQKPVEATIALSIAFVASELAKAEPGKRRLTESYPWVVAFAFGLLHGFGFAGALKEGEGGGEEEIEVGSSGESF